MLGAAYCGATHHVRLADSFVDCLHHLIQKNSRMILTELNSLVKRIQHLGNQLRELELIIEQVEDSLSDDRYDELVEEHNNLVKEKTLAINQYNRLAGRNIRVGLFN